MSAKCYIRSVAQVSCQHPLSEEWLDSPCVYENKYVRAIEPDSKGLIVPAEARRMSKILKRTVCTSITVLNDSGIDQPDSIITGTGMGCMENSEKFLIDMSKFGESCLKPTLFMQSTHNTISSLIAIILKCHGYNNTYSQGAISFESALLDAWLQIKSGSIKSALIGSHDEVTPLMALVLEKTHPEYSFVSEASVAAMLSSSSNEDALVEISDVFIGANLSPRQISEKLSADDSAILWGTNGNEMNDKPYKELLNDLSYSPFTLKYKHIFGENFSASAIAFYVAVCLLKENSIPGHLLDDCAACEPEELKSITIINNTGDSTWSIIRLKKN